MMGRKEFGQDARGHVFMSDERDIAIPWSKRHEVHAWAEQNEIAIKYQGTLGGLDVWRVQDDQHRAWFNLRWS